MKRWIERRVGQIGLLCVVAAVFGAAMSPAVACTDTTLAAVLSGEHRSAADTVRDAWRHPCDTLNFFGLKPDMRVVEIWPGSGWYTDVIALYVHERGVYHAAHFDQDSPSHFFRETRAAFEQKMASSPNTYEKVLLATFDPSADIEGVPAGSADLVLTFRNVHNWYMRGGGDERVISAFRRMYDVLKPGGVLGVVEHRLPATADVARQDDTGYMHESEVVRLAGAAGFVLVARSEINANPADTADHPDGVWSLPPTLRGVASSADHFSAIGESDRMTLRFKKPTVTLAPCPDSRNCVSSMESRERYQIAPVYCSADPGQMRERLLQELATDPRASVVVNDEERVVVEFRTRWLGFVDDAVFLFRQGRIEMRSASRFGYSDFGVNRARLDALRAVLEDDSCAVCIEGRQHEHQASQVVSGTLYLDNDLFTGRQQDKDYTGGFAVAFSGDDATRHPFSIDGALGRIDRFSRIGRNVIDADFTLNSCEAGMTVFTPEDIAVPTPILTDRPYASLLYLSNTRQSIDLDRRVSLISTLSLGALGLGVAGDIQNAIHGVTGSAKAAGWKNQVSSGGEPTVRYSVSRLSHFDTGAPWWQATGTVGAGLGYITDVSTGVAVRAGRLRTPWWNLDEDSGKYGAKAHAEVPTSRRLDEIYLVAGATAHYRVYNAFLQGQFRDSAVAYGADDIRNLVSELWLGVSCEWDGFRLSYIVRQQSSEVDVGSADRSYRYGALIMTFRF